MARPRRTATSRSTDNYRHDDPTLCWEAVTNCGEMGQWAIDHCGGPGSVKAVLARHAA